MNSVPAAGWSISNNLGEVASATTSATMSTNVKFARVTDTRSGSFGWSLTADFDGKLHSAGGNDVGGVSIAVRGLACGETSGASGSAAASVGSSGTLTSPRVLCSVAAGALGNTGLHGG